MGGCPSHWADTVREEEGGSDTQGIRPQDGRDIFNKEALAIGVGCGTAWAQDDVSGKELNHEMVLTARREEVRHLKKTKVYTRVPRSQQRTTGGNITKVRWIDVNKEDFANAIYCSRIVGKEFNTGKDDNLYAATPPLEALRTVTS